MGGESLQKPVEKQAKIISEQAKPIGLQAETMKNPGAGSKQARLPVSSLGRKFVTIQS
jgi:hypothetical protein